MSDPLLLYSTATWLAFMVAERYYGGLHYVWCSPFYSSASMPSYTGVPPTACPAEIYRNLQSEVRAGDRHSEKIRSNKAGILRGAAAKHCSGVVSDDELREIEDVVRIAETSDFRPLLLVMPFSRVKELARGVPPSDRAHPLSPELLIEELPRDRFDIVDLEM